MGGATVVSLLGRWCPIIRGHGIPETMEAVLTRKSKVWVVGVCTRADILQGRIRHLGHERPELGWLAQRRSRAGASAPGGAGSGETG
jgi:hypothetical protein